SKFQAYWRDLARLDKQSLAWREYMSPGDSISKFQGSASNSGPNRLKSASNSS
ncbi:hypothetical protein A2U01_0031686, partial [Trifolium medium]|nr:hypothetical protein [Trifolium medium]